MWTPICARLPMHIHSDTRGHMITIIWINKFRSSNNRIKWFRNYPMAQTMVVSVCATVVGFDTCSSFALCIFGRETPQNNLSPHALSPSHVETLTLWTPQTKWCFLMVYAHPILRSLLYGRWWFFSGQLQQQHLPLSQTEAPRKRHPVMLLVLWFGGCSCLLTLKKNGLPNFIAMENLIVHHCNISYIF